ncbi:MAG: adenylate kinase [Acidimicrobiales bacterium]|nr:adenylate kinase [Acidimicrobiales bacterium]
MIPGVRLVVFGRQGAGKGTQCVRLSRHYVVPHISTGDMLRAAVKEGTAFGRRAKEYMDAGELLPDDVIIGVVEERLARSDTSTRGFILDGFPRTVAQAEALAGVAGPGGIDLAVDLEVARDVVLRRLAGRRVCADCGTNYSIADPPGGAWVCEHCGGDVIQRPDDTEAAIARRLDLYDRETAPLVAWFDDRGLLVVVDGVGSPDAVSDRLVAAIDARRHRRPTSA